MAEATGTITNYNGIDNSKKLVEDVGSFSPFNLIRYVPSTADATATTVDITFTGLTQIVGWLIEFDENGVRDADNDAQVSASGNVLTIANGGANYTLATTDNIYILVFGKSLA